MNHEADRGRDGDPNRLGNDDVTQLLQVGQSDRDTGFPLCFGNGDQCAPPNFTEEGTGINGETNGCRRQWRQVVPHNGQAKIKNEQPAQQRYALDCAHVAESQAAQHPEPRRAQGGDQQAYGAATQQGQYRQPDGPADRQHQVIHIQQGEFANHRLRKIR